MSINTGHFVNLGCFHFQTVVKILSITRDDTNTLKLQLNHIDIASVSLGAQSATSSNNLLAYRPNYSGLTGFFINLDGVFPCISGRAWPDTPPPCSRFTYEEDGFNGGRAISQAGDMGNNFRIFSSTEDIPTYGLAVSGCNTNDCFPAWYAIHVVCLLPRETCG